MEQIVIRKANVEDYAAVELIMKQVQELHVGWRPDTYKSVEVVLLKDEFIQAIEEECFFVATIEEKVVGVLEIVYRHVEFPHQVTRDFIYIDTMAVDEKYRGMGVGHSFFEFLKILKKDKGMKSIELQVNARNEAARKMYEKCGFTPKSINMELIS